jgi:hypothetical protein
VFERRSRSEFSDRVTNVALGHALATCESPIVKRFCSALSRHVALAPLAALCIYTTSACAIFTHHHFFFRHAYFGTSGDPQIYMWFLSWWPYAITHRLNPFVTHIVWAPNGINLTWATGIPALALLAWPITAHWGPIVSFNLLTTVAPILSAFAAFLLCNALTNKYFPSLVGGWVFGFSSYEIGQLIGHLPLDFTACIPALAWLAVLRYRSGISGRIFVAAGTGLLTFQFGTSTEIFATVTLFGFITLILCYLLRAADRRRLMIVATEFSCCYIICLIVVSPYLYYMVKEHSAVPPLLQPRDVYVADVLNYLVPTQTTAVNGAWAASISTRFTGNDAENGAYLGLPLLMIIAAFGLSSWRDRQARILLPMFLVLVLCSFGPYLHFKGRSLFPMPWWLGEKLPLLGQALPVRFSLYISLVAGIIAALWLASLSEQQSMLGYMLALLAVLALMPNTRGKRSYWFTELRDLNVPAFFSTGDYMRVLKPGDNIIVLPYGHLGYSMLWQVVSGMYFRIAEGYVTAYVPPAFARFPAVQMFYAGKPAPAAKDYLGAFCKAKGVEAVILTADAGKEWDSTLRRMDWKRMEVGGVILYRIPQR